LIGFSENELSARFSASGFIMKHCSDEFIALGLQAAYPQQILETASCKNARLNRHAFACQRHNTFEV
jgi:hypothetical protein